MNTHRQQFVRLAKALGNEARVEILRLLKRRALCVGALAARLDITPGGVSQHLRILRDAGLVIPEKRGCWVHYRLNDRVLAEWRKAVDDLLAPVEGEARCAAAMNRRRAARSRRT